MAKLTRTQLIRVFALVPAAYSLAVLVICVGSLVMFGLFVGGQFVFIAAIIALVAGGLALGKALFRR